MNKVILSGNLCKEIELKTTKSDKAYTENTIAVRRDRKDDNGEYSSDFINMVCFGINAKYLYNYSKKGDKVELEGQMRTDSWKDDNGLNHYKTYVVVEKLNIITARNTNVKTKEDMPF